MASSSHEEREVPLGERQAAYHQDVTEMSSNRSWPLFGQRLPKSEVVFFMQVILIYIVVITSILNLTLYKDQSGKLWTALLSSSLGYLLPNPTLKRRPA
jgi:hypothetical protein